MPLMKPCKQPFPTEAIMQRKVSLLSVKIISSRKQRRCVARMKIMFYGKVSLAESFNSFSWSFCPPVHQMAFNSFIPQKPAQQAVEQSHL